MGDDAEAKHSQTNRAVGKTPEGRGDDDALGNRSGPPADAERLPVGRDPHPEMGRRRPDRAGPAAGLSLLALAAICRLLGHSDIETMARYTHMVQDPIHETADEIAESVAAEIL